MLRVESVQRGSILITIRRKGGHVGGTIQGSGLTLRLVLQLSMRKRRSCSLQHTRVRVAWHRGD